MLPNPESDVVALATGTPSRSRPKAGKIDLLVSAAAPEGARQRPLQCDNLVLMRMNSAADLAHLVESFSFVPPSMFGEARHFGLGGALVAGKISPNPTLIRFGADFGGRRVGREGHRTTILKRHGPAASGSNQAEALSRQASFGCRTPSAATSSDRTAEDGLRVGLGLRTAIEHRILTRQGHGFGKRLLARTRSVPRCPVLYEGGPITVTGVPMGVSGQTWAAVAMGISTHPLLWGVP